MKIRWHSKLVALGGAAALSVFALAGCTSGNASSGNALSQAQQQRDTTQLEFVEPLPTFQYSQIRFDLIQIEAIEALGLNSVTYGFMPGNNQGPIFSCPSVGLPVPVTDELSNPWQGETVNSGANGNTAIAVGQEDPNGVFQGDSTGTNVLCINSKGQTYDQYTEGYDDTTTAASHWDSSTGQIVVTGAPVMPVWKHMASRPERGWV